MPAFTPNRNYPYSVDSDPAEVYTATEDFANAVDVDVQSQYDRVQRRAVAKAWSTTPRKYTTVQTATTYLVNFDGFQVNTDNFATLQGTRVIPTLPGFYFFIATISFGKPTGTVTPTNLSVVALFNSSSVVSRSGLNGTVISADNTAELVCAGGQFMNGTTDYMEVSFAVVTPATVPNMTIYTRSLTLIRMTQS